jgi:hypothetical protein
LDVVNWDVAEKAFWILSASQDRSELFFETCWDEPEYGDQKRRAVEDWPTEIVMHKSARDLATTGLLPVNVLATVRLGDLTAIPGVSYEQLIVSEVDVDFVKLECVPFRFWDLNIGDIVHICSNENGHQTVRNVETASGNKTLRFVRDIGAGETIETKFLSLVEERRGICEYEEDGSHGVISVAGMVEAESLLDYLSSNRDSVGLSWIGAAWQVPV